MQLWHSRSFKFLCLVVALTTSFILHSIVSGQIGGSTADNGHGVSWLGEKLSVMPRAAWSYFLYVALGTVLGGSVSVRISAPLVVAIGTLIALLGIAGISLMTSAGTLEIALLLAGLGLGMSGFPLIAAISGVLFPARRRLTGMMSVLAVALAFEFFLCPSDRRVSQLMDTYGAATFLSLGAVLMISVVGLLVAHRKAEAEDPVLRPILAEAVRQMGTNSSFWTLAYSVFIVGYFSSFVIAHLESLNLTGMLPEAVQISAIFNVIGFIGLIGAGWFGHLVSIKRMVGTLHLISAVSLAIYAFAPLLFPPALFLSTAVGLAWLSIALLVSNLAADLFGTRYLGLLFGAFYFVHFLGETSSRVVTEVVVYLTEEADLTWFITIILGLIAVYLQKGLIERRPENVQSNMRVNRILSK